MSYVVVGRTELNCDLCTARLDWKGLVPRIRTERLARERYGWRKDKLGRNLCQAHPKLKGARQ